MFRKGDLFDYYGDTYEVKEVMDRTTYEYDYKVLDINTGKTHNYIHDDPMTLTEEPYENTEDMVNSPTHYKQEGKVECIDYIESFLSHEEYQGYLRGNVAKYLHRWRRKGKPLEDLHKAQWYLDRLEKLEKKKTL